MKIIDLVTRVDAWGLRYVEKKIVNRWCVCEASAGGSIKSVSTVNRTRGLKMTDRHMLQSCALPTEL